MLALRATEGNFKPGRETYSETASTREPRSEIMTINRRRKINININTQKGLASPGVSCPRAAACFVVKL